MTSIFLSRLHFPVTTLGPGKRVGVWFQGCSIKCAGCISMDTWDGSVGKTTLSEALNTIEGWISTADGLTVSGGEPFDQPEALASLLKTWRSLANSNVLLFTGYELDDVLPWIGLHPGLIDGIVTGPYDGRAGNALALRGSDNQRLHILTEAGKVFSSFERPANAEDRRLDVMFDADGGAWFAGIPARGDMQRLRRALNTEGHSLLLSDETAGRPL